MGESKARLQSEANPWQKHETLSEKQLKKKGLGLWLK
jgi:hypothetical protein